jgi:hypothetical protein
MYETKEHDDCAFGQNVVTASALSPHDPVKGAAALCYPIKGGTSSEGGFCQGDASDDASPSRGRREVRVTCVVPQEEAVVLLVACGPEAGLVVGLMSGCETLCRILSMWQYRAPWPAGGLIEVLLVEQSRVVVFQGPTAAKRCLPLILHPEASCFGSFKRIEVEFEVSA